MKFLFYGNQGNFGYNLTRQLRDYSLEGELWVPYPLPNARSYPEWQDPNLKAGYPEWIKTVQLGRLQKTFPFPSTKLRQAAKEVDLIITNGQELVYTYSLKRPKVIIPLGGDINNHPFNEDNIIRKLRAYYYRRTIRQSDLILTAQENCYWAARLIGAERVEPFAFPIDFEGIRKGIDNYFYENLRAKYKDYDYVFFLPSRKNLRPVGGSGHKRGYKGPERFIKAYKEFLRKSSKRVIALCTLHGFHWKEFKEMCIQEGLEEYFDFCDQLPVYQLHAVFKLPNVIVIDKLKDEPKSVIGGAHREALVFGAPVISALDSSNFLFQKAYGQNCPSFTATTTEEAYRRMLEVTAFSEQEMVEYRKRAAAWAEASFGVNSSIPRLINMLEAVVKG